MADVPGDTPVSPLLSSARVIERKRETRKSVLLMDKIADWTITVGGLFVILAVFGIMVFLLQVVVPLFTGGNVADRTQFTLSANVETISASTDEYHTVVVRLLADGGVSAFHLKSGAPIAMKGFDFGGKKVTAFARTQSWDQVAFGFEDGSIRFGRMLMRAEVISADKVPANLQRLGDRDQTDGSIVYSSVPGNQYRKISMETSLEDEQKVFDSTRPVTHLDYHVGGTTERPIRTFVAVNADNVVRVGTIETRVNLLTRRATVQVQTATLPPLSADVKVLRVLTTEKGDQAYVLDAGGTVFRFDTRDMRAPVLAETINLLPRTAQLTVFGFLIGGQSIIAGDSEGRVDVYLRLERPGAKSTDGFTLVRSHTLERHDAAVVGYSPSQRGKLFLTADASGAVWLRHSTSEQTSIKVKVEVSGGVKALLLTPREDGIVVVDGVGKVAYWEVSVPHPETTVKSIFGKIWYEGYAAPTYTWQSSSGTDSFEPKLSLVPLIFGTIKATLYALLFAVPIALMAAIYTSELIHPKVRATVKPVMEMMASLPSVVLGFIAALILAPLVETWIAAVLMAFIGVPLCLLFGAFAWQLLPQPLAIRLQGLPKFSLMFVVLGLGFWLCYAAGPVFEKVFFAGDFRAWANGDVGSGTGFLTLVLLPLSFIAVAVATRNTIGTRFRDAGRGLPAPTAGALDFVRWFVLFALASGLSFAIAIVVNALGGDPRGGIVGTYVQRNTLVVGFAMAFAVIPAIYTIAEDALNSVPEHLRGASLACGATPWQTAVRIILPTAASGVFAAIMVGMGRAVGETMIVVMAAGNTPILEWNLFNGLRALSANIAVELPEAVKDGTLYRTLFLAALTLFVMTFVVNTIAELVRQRFRKRAVEL